MQPVKSPYGPATVLRAAPYWQRVAVASLILAGMLATAGCNPPQPYMEDEPPAAADTNAAGRNQAEPPVAP